MSARINLVLIAVVLCIPAIAKAQKPGNEVFGPDKVWEFHLTLMATEYGAMQPALPAFPGFPGSPMPPKSEPKPGDREMHRGAFGTDFPWAIAAFTADGQTIEKVGLRYKGNATYMMSSRSLKRSLKIDIDRHDESARFHGLKSLTLNCGVFDPSKCREALAYSIYRAAGVPAPRTAFAQVALTVPGKFDREHIGLYTLVEDVDKNFLKANFKNTTGLILKPERIPGLMYLGEDWARYKDTYRPRREATPAEVRRVIDFTKLVSAAPDETFNKGIASYIDIYEFLKFVATTAIIANLDNFANGHNYCLYLNPETNKFTFIPWDLDLALAGFPFLGATEQMDLSLTKPYFGQCRLIERILANKEYAERYQEVLKETARVCFDKDKVLAEVAALEKVVKPLIEKETKAVAARKENAFGPPGGPGPFGRSPPDLKTFVEKRFESIAAQLAGKSKGYSPGLFGPGGPGGPGPGRPNVGEFVLPPPLQNALQLNDAQKRDIAALQKKVDEELDRILTPEQRGQLKRMREGGGPQPGIPPKP